MSQQMPPLDPTRIDEYIDTARTANHDGATDDPSARLVRSLHGAYAMPAATRTAVLDRVHERLRAEMELPSTARLSVRPVANVPPIDLSDDAPRQLRDRPVSRMRSAFGAVAAVLVVALLAGAFYAVTQSSGAGRVKRRGAGPTATHQSTPGPIGVWQDVSISSGNTGGKLDFDPTKGSAYSVAASDGTVYACGSGHLWYSQDGGAHYSPFSPALPSSFASGISGACTMTTVQGWPGVFIAPNNSPDNRSVLYAGPGDGSWQKLIMSGTATPAGGSASPTRVSPPQILLDLFNSANYESLTPAVQASGDWLYFVSAGGSSYDVVGTHDFGQTWVDVSASDMGDPCTHFVVSAHNYDFLACQPSSAGNITETLDGGKTWRSLTGGVGDSLYLFGMSDSAIYATYANPTYTEHVVTHDVKSGDWLDQGSVFAANLGGPLMVTSDNTVYFPVLDDQTATRLSVYTYTPSSQGPRQILAYTSIPGVKGGTRAFGGLQPGAPPAIYTIETPAKTGPTAVYRMYLPAVASAPASTTPTVAPTATAIGNVACTQAAGDPANIQPGGVGADTSTFATRWGKQDGVAAGSSYFGPLTAQGVPEIQVTNGYARAYELFYNVSSGQKMAPSDATTLAKSILPTDATPITQLQSVVDPQSGVETLQQLYCSAAYLAVAPPSGQATTYPVPRNGVIRVTFTLGQVGNVQIIAFGPVR